MSNTRRRCRRRSRRSSITDTSTGCREFPEPQLTKQTLESTLTPAVRGQDLYILIPMLNNPASQNADVGLHADEL